MYSHDSSFRGTYYVLIKKLTPTHFIKITIKSLSVYFRYSFERDNGFLILEKRECNKGVIMSKDVVKPSDITFNSMQIDIIKRQFAPTISDEDLEYCLEIARVSGLNPILKEIYFVPRRAKINGVWVEKHEPMVGRDGARKVARKKGMKRPPNTGYEIKKTPVYKDGKFTLIEDLVGYAELIIDGEMVRKEAEFSVYKKTDKEGEPTNFWRTMPTVMVQKVAEFQLLKAIYGLDGLMSIDVGLVEEEVEVTPSIEKSKAIALMESLKLEYKIDGDILYVENGYNHSKILKESGFEVKNNKFFCVITEEVVKTNETNETNETKELPKPKEDGPAMRLAKLLKEKGLSAEQIGEFVKDNLKVTSKDTEKIEEILTDKQSLLAKVIAYKKELSSDPDDVEDENPF